MDIKLLTESMLGHWRTPSGVWQCEFQFGSRLIYVHHHNDEPPHARLAAARRVVKAAWDDLPQALKFAERHRKAQMPELMRLYETHMPWELPQPGSNRGYPPEQLIELLIVSIWCGAARFAHTDITRLDTTLVRLFDWGRAAGHKAIVRLFQRFEQASASRVQRSSYRWLFDKLRLNPITLGVDSTVLTLWGAQIEGGTRATTPSTLLMNNLGSNVIERIECCSGTSGVCPRFRSDLYNKAT